MSQEDIIEKLTIKNIEFENENLDLQIRIGELEQELENYKDLQSQNTQLEGDQDPQKLVQVIQLLQSNQEQEKAQYEAQIAKYIMVIEKIPELQEKANNYDQLKEQLQKKEKDIEFLQENLEAHNDTNEGMEILVQKQQQYEKKIEELNEQITLLKTEEETNNEIVNFLETNEKELVLLNEQKNEEINELKLNQEKLEQIISELDINVQKFREKCENQQKQIEMLNEGLKKTGNKGDQNVQKINQLLQKQADQQIIINLKHRKLFNQLLKSIHAQNHVNLYQQIIQAIPFKQKIAYDELEYFQNILAIKMKCQFLIDEIYGESDKWEQNNYEFLEWIFSLGIILSEIVRKGNYLCSEVQSLSKDDFVQIRGIYSIQQFQELAQCVETLILDFKEDRLSSKIKISQYMPILNNIKLNNSYIPFEIPHQILILLTNTQLYLGKITNIHQNLNEDIQDQLTQIKVKLQDIFTNIISQFELILGQESIYKLHDNANNQNIFNNLKEINGKLEEWIKESCESQQEIGEQLKKFQMSINSQLNISVYQSVLDEEHDFKKGPWVEIHQGFTFFLDNINLIEKDKADYYETIQQLEAEKQQFNSQIEMVNRQKSVCEQRIMELQIKSDKASKLEKEKKKLEDKDRLNQQMIEEMNQQIEYFSKEKEEYQMQSQLMLMQQSKKVDYESNEEQAVTENPQEVLNTPLVSKLMGELQTQKNINMAQRLQKLQNSSPHLNKFMQTLQNKDQSQNESFNQQALQALLQFQPILIEGDQNRQNHMQNLKQIHQNSYLEAKKLINKYQIKKIDNNSQKKTLYAQLEFQISSSSSSSQVSVQEVQLDSFQIDQLLNRCKI